MEAQKVTKVTQLTSVELELELRAVEYQLL